MYRLALSLVAGLTLVTLAFAAAPPEGTVQGLYEGTATVGPRQLKLEARLVALANNSYKLLVRQKQPDGKITKIELAGKVDNDTLRFAPKSGWSGSYADGVIKGDAGPNATFELKRVTRQSPTLGAKPPAGAIVLLDGKNFDEVTNQPNKDGSKQEWNVTQEGAIQVPKGGMNSKRQFSTSIKIHVEFHLPLMPGGDGQGRANSGCYLPNGDEIQVLDSFGMTTYTGGGCGGLYRYKDPDTFDEFSLASLPPLQWQTYDIEYRIETKDGKPAGKPRVTVLHNGIKIHDNAQLEKDAKVGGLNYQDHGNAVQYRNIWVVPIEGK